MNWEKIHDRFYIERCRVSFGWLVRQIDEVHVKKGGDWDPQKGWEWRGSICYVFDPFRTWKLDKTKN